MARIIKSLGDRRIFQPPAGNAKLAHGNAEWYVMTLSLSASDSSGHNECSKAFPVSRIESMLRDGWTVEQIGRVAAASGLSMCSYSCCVNRSGRGNMANVQGARRTLTDWLHDDRDGFVRAATDQLLRERRRADRHGYRLAIRPNCNSDRRWEVIAPDWFDIVEQAYDYTKLSNRLGSTPPNYHLTYSVSDGTLPEDWERVHTARAGIAVVFDVDWRPNGPEHSRRYGVLPTDWTDPTGYRWEVIDGDAIDARFLDPVRTLAGLRLKGTIAGRDCARSCGFADCRFSGGLSVSRHPALAIL